MLMVDRGLSRPSPHRRDAPQRIVIIRLDNIGDVVLSSSMLRELRSLYPGAWLTLVVNSYTRPLVEHCPYVNEVLDVSLAYTSVFSVFADLGRAFRFFRSTLGLQSWDMAIMPRWGPDTHFATLLAAWTGATRRIAFSERTSKERRRLNRGFDRLYTDVLPGGSLKHEAEHNLDIVRYLGGKIQSAGLEVWLSPSDQASADRYWTEAGLANSATVIAFGVGAKHSRRRWPAFRFAQLIEDLSSGLEFIPLVLCGPEDKALARAIRDRVKAAPLIPEDLSIRQTAALLGRCALFIGNDSGPMHLAAAMGLPTIEISCHPAAGDPEHENSPDRFGPFTDRRAILRPWQATPPCVSSCQFHEPHCITAVSVDSVAEKVTQMLDACLLTVHS